MEEKKKISFLDDNGYDYDHLILNESQIRLLNYLREKQELRKKFNYIIEENIEWKEI